ncbi:molybdenum cofactor sulfurase-like isoform X2 [Polypterus senegalus]|uniref:molybdenum cofactor sulfurase-like isoform X2 n=1 Tax=Polypterus senegalus TaxID=55291 RepID=UPI001962B5F2|nr:molybdenum cofactor sulfurase-like isoform X2 [Polypterus senegalus]
MAQHGQLSSLQYLSSFHYFQRISPHYGYEGDLQVMKEKEFSRIKDITYLDHAGATLFPQSQVKNFMKDLEENVYGNPHSHNMSSQLTRDTVERVRYSFVP